MPQDLVYIFNTDIIYPEINKEETVVNNTQQLYEERIEFYNNKYSFMYTEYQY